jgi:hypothetical protein
VFLQEKLLPFIFRFVKKKTQRVVAVLVMLRRYIMITEIERLLDKELANVRGNEDVCSDISGSQKSRILEDRISSQDTNYGGWKEGWTLTWSR